MDNRCSRCGKNRDSRNFALYELFEDGSKEWRTNLCDKCDKFIAQNNKAIEQEYPLIKFKDTTAKIYG
jgi:hypothetical protein